MWAVFHGGSGASRPGCSAGRLFPMMIKACLKMLDSLGVSAGQIAFDEF